MIIDAILNGFFFVVNALFSIFPAFPAMPELIVTGWNWFLNATVTANGLIIYLLGVPLYLMIISLIVFMTTFYYIYHFFIRFIILKIAFKVLGR